MHACMCFAPQVRKGDFNFKHPVWAKVSAEGIQFIKFMLRTNPARRCVPVPVPWCAMVCRGVCGRVGVWGGGRVGGRVVCVCG